jgi:hypothetical protein
MANFINTDITFFKKYKLPVITLLWFLLAAVAAVLELSRGISAINNYLIFKGVFTHSMQQLPLYNLYPLEYEEKNHFGPLFAIVIAPFTFLPNIVGVVMWNMANAGFLFWAIQKLPMSSIQKKMVLAIGLVEMMTAAHNVQFNASITACIVLGYVFVKEEKDIWATLFIAIGFLVKLYGIVGIFFWLFSKHKVKYIVYGIMWLAILFCLPMVLSSPNFVVQSYIDWFNALVIKNDKNTVALNNGFMQDISVMGMVRRIFKIESLPNIYVLLPALLAYVLVVTQTKKYSNILFQLQCLALALIGSVIFSTSAESPTYVIAMMGVGIWYCTAPATIFNKIVLVFTLVFTSLSATDLLPFFIREYFIKPYSLKALPCFVVWCVLLYNMLVPIKTKHLNTANAE